MLFPPFGGEGLGSRDLGSVHLLLKKIQITNCNTIAARFYIAAQIYDSDCIGDSSIDI